MDKVSVLKNVIRESAFRLGLFEVGRVMRRNRITILCYHRFSHMEEANGAISGRLFEAHLKYLRKHFTCIPLNEIHRLKEGRLKIKNPLVLTVDDGYKDFAEVAVPLLEKYGIPATLFATTRFIDGEIWLWPDIVTYSIRETREQKIGIAGCEPDLPLRTASEKATACDKLTEICKQMKEKEKAQFLTEIADRLHVKIPPAPPPEFQPLSWDELRGLDNGLINIGSHTLTHPILSRVSVECANMEISESKKRLEQELDTEITAFAYPNGLQGDYTNENKAAVQNSGYLYAVICNFGINAFDSDMFELNRIVAQYDLSSFVKEVSGFENLREQLFSAAGEASSNQRKEQVLP